jgi:oxygen-independent coproporphyrinogen-3 oxidase
MELLEEEGRLFLAERLDTLFVGGGTPSLLGPAAMGGLRRILGNDRLSSPRLEWTGEANPESFTRVVAEGWARAGVNRVSLGAQSFQDGPLKWMGRQHGPDGPGRAVQRAREAGIRNVSIDLMFGLPDEVPRDWEEDVEAALALETPHLSLYGLTLEPGTPLGREAAEGRVTGVDEARYREEFLFASERLATAGYRQYELSNFSLPGFECRHNEAYWTLVPFLGLGSSAHSYRFPHRRWNLRSWSEYQNAVFSGELPTEGQEELDAGAVRLEVLWLGLRTDEGIAVASLSPEGRALAREWTRQGWARLGTDSLRLTPEGWLLMDRLVLELDAVDP